MKDTFINFYDGLKERIKTALQEQQESELYIRIKEKFDSLSPLLQKLTIGGVALFFASLLLWYPFSTLLTASDEEAKFDQRRQNLKDLLKIQRDFNSLPPISVAPPPFSLKGQLDQIILGKGIAVEQIKDSSDASNMNIPYVEQRGIKYQISHVTVRQAIDIAYDLEQVDKSFRLADFELSADQKDPHFYDLKLKIINFAPKSQAVAIGK